LKKSDPQGQPPSAKKENAMHIFHIRYRNTQGTLMRILSAASRRGIDLPYVQAEPSEHAHKVTLLMDVNVKQVGQLCRDWHAIVDVMDVRPGMPIKELFDHPHLGIPRPPESVAADTVRTATA
jgi:acetolactate synthase regulatory subunit